MAVGSPTITVEGDVGTINGADLAEFDCPLPLPTNISSQFLEDGDTVTIANDISASFPKEANLYFGLTIHVIFGKETAIAGELVLAALAQL